ncbi:unnamed protein product [Phytomonas sp. Hart1]|nr:unnamed protein product [Phytomonas sp. Hart1]|eukprot:CCW67059.1 unnamed protein product [Phytomonas sp. isolate Hart1]
MTYVAKKKPIPVRNPDSAECISTIKSYNASSSHFILPSDSPNTKHGNKSFLSSIVNKGGVKDAIKPHTASVSTKLNTLLTRNSRVSSPFSRNSSTLKRRRSKKSNTTAISKLPEGLSALRVLRTLFLPVVLKKVLRQRRIKKWKGVYPPRNYTNDSVVSALCTSNATLLQFPLEMIQLLAREATFIYLLPNEPLVYFNESHLSCGIVVILYGHLVERRPDKGGPGAQLSERDAVAWPVSSQYVRMCNVHDVLCMVPVLCEDRSRSSFSCGPGETTDVAVISSRWFWKVFMHFVVESPQSEKLLEGFREHVVPLRRDILLTSYYPSPVLFQRSWIGTHLSLKDRLKLCSTMEVMVLGAGDILFNAGDSCKYIYFMRRGTLTIVVNDQPLTSFGPGVAFGEESALFGDTWNCTAVVSTVCELYTLSLRALHHRLEKKPTLANALINGALRRRKVWMEEGRNRSLGGLVHLLGRVPCLSHTTDAMRRAIAHKAEIMVVPAGFEFARRNLPCECLYVIGKGFVRMARLPDLVSKHQASVAAVDEVRGVGSFFGELCLRPHCWPTDIISETLVDVWVLRRETILEILFQAKADAQAEVVCRQGIDLYRAQFGEHSILEVYDNMFKTSDSFPRQQTRLDLYASSKLSQSLATCKVTHRSSLHSLDDQAQTILEGFDWIDYARQNRQKVVDGTGFPASEGIHLPYRGKVSWMLAVEKALNTKALSLISVPPDLPPSSADCDFPGEVDELQAVVVEQLLLSPSEDHEQFLCQLNNSNVMLVTDIVPPNDSFDTSSNIEDATSAERADALLSRDELPKEVVGPTGDAYVFDIDTLKEPEHLDWSQSSIVEVDATNNRPLPLNQDMCANLEWNNSESAQHDAFSHTLKQFLALEGRKSLPLSTLQPHHASSGRSYKARSESCLLFSTSKGGPTITIGNTLSALEHVQGDPIADIGLSPRRRAVKSASGSRVGSAMTIVRSAKVDHVQYSTHCTDRSSSILDRLVKIKGQNYFNTLVKVIPMPQDEFWIPEESDGAPSQFFDKIPFVLVLMHILGCNDLDPAVTSSCVESFVKVSVGERVLLRTTSLKDPVRPTWPVESSTFISLLKPKSVVRFELCDRQQENEVLYASSLPMSSTHERGGVGKCVMRLTSLSSAAAEASGKTPDNRLGPYMTVVMIVVASAKSSQYASTMPLQRSVICSPAPAQESPPSTASLLVMGVRGLKHRLWARITVTLRQDGAPVELLKTPPAASKTRTPSWRPQEVFVNVQLRGIMEFNLYHKDTVIASSELTADELAFGGVGLRRLFLIAIGERRKVVGELLVYVLSCLLSTPLENQISEKILFLHAQKVSINKVYMPAYSEERMNWVFNGEPDPFVVIRNNDGKVVLRTPLVFSSLKASWRAEDASCLLPFPDLRGLKARYQLELYDNEEASTQLIDHVVFAVGRDGLDTNGLFDIALHRMRATMRLSASVLSVKNIHTPTHINVPRAQYFIQDPLLVLLHVVRFHDDATLSASAGLTATWANALWRKMQSDVVIRLSVCGEEVLRTPHGSFRGQWPIHAGSVVLRLDAGVLHSDRMVVFEIFEGLVSEAEKIGEVQVPLREFCASGCRFLSVFSSKPETVYLSTHCIGKLEIEFFCGVIGSQVFTHDTLFKRLESFQTEEYDTDENFEAEGSASAILNREYPSQNFFMHARVRFQLISLSNFSIGTNLPDEDARFVVKVTLKDGNKNMLLHSKAVPILAESSKSGHNGLSAVWEADDDSTVELNIEELQSQMILVSVNCDTCGGSSEIQTSPVTKEEIHADFDKGPNHHVLFGRIPLKTLASAAIDCVQVDTIMLTETMHLSKIAPSPKEIQEGNISGNTTDRTNAKPYLSFAIIPMTSPLSSDPSSKLFSSGIFTHA